MYTIGRILKKIREEKGLQLQTVQDRYGINSTQLALIENDKRLPTIEQIQQLAVIYEFDSKQLLMQHENDKFITSMEYPEIAIAPLYVAESTLAYNQNYFSLFQNSISAKPFAIESRRYIGSKTKLTDWIMKTIENETENIQTFCDIFAGTATISKQALKRFNKVIINDFLFSNNVIYNAFFANGDWDKGKLYTIITTYNALIPEKLPENYFSENFGGKYYEHNIAKLIGHIRQDIEELRPELTDKEYNILLATLIYNIDRLANTVGHFEAYIKKPIKSKPLQLRLIDAQCFDNVEIYRQDSNLLARNIQSDLVYIDPPYNSRQYGRFYHLYETLIKWDKPQLYGVALKPAPENISDYCTYRAVKTFEDLVSNLNTRYIVVSYNNTYNSKSHSSENKIKLEDIERILSMCGETKVFEHSHQYFNAGKTDFNNHKELLFVTRIDNEKRNKAFSTILRGR